MAAVRVSRLLAAFTAKGAVYLRSAAPDASFPLQRTAHTYRSVWSAAKVKAPIAGSAETCE